VRTLDAYVHRKVPLTRSSLLALTLAVGCSGTQTSEDCTNGIDDDGDGQIDCADLDCAGSGACPSDGGNYGTCPKCGSACTTQKACIAGDWGSDEPLPQCVNGYCQSFNEKVQLQLTLDMSAYAGLGPIVSSEATHFVSTLARDGSPVTCTTLNAISRPDAGGAIIEESGRFDVIGFDTEPVQQIRMPLTFPFISTGTTDGGYLIWIELWSLTRDSNAPHEPTGRRYIPGCIDTGPLVAPITPADDCHGDAGTCRTISFTMPAPM
jgi:hypothetical protein